jgi:manganese/iron transport system ATP-binding protein
LTPSGSRTAGATPPAGATPAGGGALAGLGGLTGTTVWLSHLTTGYGDRPALVNVDLRLEPGALAAVVGPNGGGKSTLLKVIAGLLQPWQGEVRVMGEPPGRHAHDVAYVPQAETVDWDFPVCAGDVVMMGRYARLGPFRRPGHDDREAVAAALRQVGMEAFASRQIGALSGGQRRRVFLARALAAQPQLYLLDEPVTGVDATTQEDLMRILDRESARGRTIVATTHDLGSAAQHFHSIVALNRTVIAQGDASLILDETVLLRTYGGHLIFIDGRPVLLDDAHHHDQAAPGEVHHHPEDPHHTGTQGS